MSRPNRSSLPVLFACMTVIAGAPSLSLSQGLTVSQPAIGGGAIDGMMMANIEMESLKGVESDAGLGASERTLHLPSFRVFMVAGTGELGFKGDGGLATRAHLWFAASVAVDEDGNIVVADSFNNRIRRVDARTGAITTVAGTGEQGFSGDGDRATEARLNSPSGVAVDRKGNILIADTFNHRIRIVDGRTGIISTLAGTGEQGAAGDEGLAVRAQLADPSGIVVDGEGNLLIADSANHRIRKVNRTNHVITTVAGTGVAGMSGDGGPGVIAQLNNPTAVAVNAAGHVVIADTFNNRVRLLDTASGLIGTVAGNGEEGFDGDGEPATRARLMQPSGVTVDAAGAMYLADTLNNRIRRVDPVSGIISTVAGTDVRGHAINGMTAELAPLNNPMGLTSDAFGNLVVADSGNHCVLRIMP